MIKLALIAIIVLASCSTSRDGCGTENYRHKFKAYSIQKKGEVYAVKFRSKWGELRTVNYECVPDSVANYEWVTL